MNSIYKNDEEINFIAIDFETANSKRNSVCELGMIIVENGEIVDRKHWYSMPVSHYFDDFNIKMLGYNVDTIPDKRYIKAHWFDIMQVLKPKIEIGKNSKGTEIEIVTNKVVVCHNAAFDLSCLREVADVFELELRRFDYLCTCQLSRRTHPELNSHKLKDICFVENIKLEHHNPVSDAEASTHILLNALKRYNCVNIYDLAKLLDIQIGKQYETDYCPCSIYGYRNTAKFKNETEEEKITEFDITHPFFGKQVVFTGELKSMTRKLAQRLTKNVGGIIEGGVRKNTDYLVDADFNYESLKNKKVTFLNEKGSNIKIINEQEFLKLLKNNDEKKIDKLKQFLSCESEFENIEEVG